MVNSVRTEPEVVLPDDALASRREFEDWCRFHHAEGFAGSDARRRDPDVLLFGRWLAPLLEGDESLCPHLARDGFWEAWTSLAFARAVRPGARVVDLGGHVGWFTWLALARGAERVFYAEPQPEAARCLIGGLRAAGLLWRVDRWLGSVGALWTVAELFTYGRLTGSASLVPAAGGSYTPDGSLRTSVAPLDALLDHDPEWARRPVDVVKVDVEGAEADAWDGMAGTLRRSPDALVLLEVGEARGYDLGAFLRRIRGAGYPLRVVDESDGEPAEATEDEILAEAHHAGLPVLWLRK